MYKSRYVKFTVVPAKDRFMILLDRQPFGEIKIGYDRHTWYVLNSNFVEYDVVKEIGQAILAKLY